MTKEKKDVTRAKYIKDERGVIKIQEEGVEDFKDLLNKKNEHNLEEIKMVEGLIEEVSVEEVKRALNEMKSAGPTEMTSDLIKRANITGELTGVFSGIFNGEEIPEEWKNRVTVPIYNGKGDTYIHTYIHTYFIVSSQKWVFQLQVNNKNLIINKSKI